MRRTEPSTTEAIPAAPRRRAWLRAFAWSAGTLLLHAASANAVDVVPCRVTVYANDDDPNGLNLRSGPGVAHPVVATTKDDDVRFDIVGSDGPWLRVGQMRSVDGIALSVDGLRGEAWVFGGLTAVRATRRVELRVAPDARSAAAGSMAVDAPGRVDGCEGGWVRVRNGAASGWIPPGQHCGNPVSGCV